MWLECRPTKIRCVCWISIGIGGCVHSCRISCLFEERFLSISVPIGMAIFLNFLT